MSDFLPKTEKRSIRYDFSAVETHDLSLQLASKTKELQAVKEEKKTVVSQYSTREKEIQGVLNRLSNQVADGWEFKELTMDITYHKPEQGKKTLTNSDTGKVIVEKMSDYEWNLFNQPADDNGEGNPGGAVVVPFPKKEKGSKKKSDKQLPVTANKAPKKTRRNLTAIAEELKATAGITEEGNQSEQAF